MDRTHPWRSFSDDSTAIVSEADDDYMIKIQNFGGRHFERAVHMNIISCLSFMQGVMLLCRINRSMRSWGAMKRTVCFDI
ncbi:hypothetical protein LWI28_021017 [Acer negundo]|uniref:Uncharacterized protein n=1 Tax=Acer negundo TaxID=4023 RepID=A0AAD5JIP0_ACENE|nr:hypothetical protein LWI28_021017 [Acer negundo]